MLNMERYTTKEDIMKKFFLGVVFLATISFVGTNAVSAFGQALIDKDLEQRFTNQQNRIGEAIKSKQLTQDESKVLQDNLNRLREEGVRLQTDGKLTQEEKAQLNKLLDQNGEMIRDKKQYPVKAIAMAAPTAPTAAPATPVGQAKPAVTIPAKPSVTAPAIPAVTAPAKPATPVPAAQDPEIREKIASQQKRIDEGIKSNQLTLNEAKILGGNLNQIREDEALFRQDGTLTKEDKAELLGLLEDNDKMIKDKKNNPVKDIIEHKALSERQLTIPERLAKQQRRINQGIKSKKLTSEESKILLDNLDYIKKDEARLRTDKKLTPQEQDRLHTLLDQNSAMIEKKKDNPVKAVK
jgi:hypothetical protein